MGEVFVVTSGEHTFLTLMIGYVLERQALSLVCSQGQRSSHSALPLCFSSRVRESRPFPSTHKPAVLSSLTSYQKTDAQILPLACAYFFSTELPTV